MQKMPFKTSSLRWLCLAPLLMALPLTACDDFMPPPSLDVVLPDGWTSEAPPPPRPEEKPAPLARDWWKAANDPTLNALMEKIETQNLSLEQARLRLQAARNDVGGSPYLPHLGLTQSTNFEPVSIFQANNNPSGVPENSHLSSRFGGYHQLGLDANWEIPLFGSYHAAEEEAKASVAFATADIDAVRSAVYADAVTDYIELRRAQNRLELLRSMEALETHIAQLNEIRINAGLSDASERNKDTQTLLALRSEIATAESTITGAKQSLAKLGGTTKTDPALDAVTPPVTFPIQQFTDTPADVMRNRPDIRKAEQSVIMAADELKLAKNERYPKLTIEGQLFQYNNIIGRPQPDTAPAGSFTEGITMPLFNWGRIEAAAHVKDAKLAESASAYRETVINAVTESQSRLADYNAALAQAQAANESLAQATTMQDQATTLNNQGLNNKIALENAAIAKQRATLEAANATSNASISLTNLTKALGGGLAEQPGDESAKKDK